MSSAGKKPVPTKGKSTVAAKASASNNDTAKPTAEKTKDKSLVSATIENGNKSVKVMPQSTEEKKSAEITAEELLKAEKAKTEADLKVTEKKPDEIISVGKHALTAETEKAESECEAIEMEEEEHIEYINLDEIDGSDQEEMYSKAADAITSLSDRVFDEDVMDFLKSLGLKGSPESLELEILKMPTLDVVTTETKHVRESRRIIIYPISSTDLSHSTIQRILGRESCTNFNIKCDRSGDSHAWNGCAVLTFSTASAAATAISELRQMRRSLHIEQGNVVDSKFAKLQPEVPQKDWTEMMLVVKNIGESATEKVLLELFPDADVIIHKDKTGSSAKGHAYLLYSSAERAKEVLDKYSKKKLEINNRRLILMKWRQTLPKIVPDGMLRIGERRLILQTFEDTKAKLEKPVDRDYLQAKLKFLQELIERDDGIRKLVGLPLPSYEQLKKLTNLRHFGDSESSQILKRLMEPFDKVMKEKDRGKERERENEQDKDKQRNQDSAGKSKSKPTIGSGRGIQNKSDNRGSNNKSVRNPTGFRGKTSLNSSRSNNTSKRAPIPLLSTPIIPVKKPGTGLLGAGPTDPTMNILLQQQRNSMVQPLLPPQSLLTQQSILQAPGCFSVPNPAGATLFGNQSSLLGSYPGDIIPTISYEDEPYRKIARYGSIEHVKDRDLFSPLYDERDQEIHAREYDHGRRGSSRDELEAAFAREQKKHYRDDRDNRTESRRERSNDQYYHKDVLSAGDRGLEVEQLFRDERSLAGRIDSFSNPRSLLSSLSHQDDDSNKAEYRREWDHSSHYDEREERRLRESQSRNEDRMSRMEEDSSRRQSSSSSAAKADPVSLLLNLSQLLAEKLQRDKEKEKGNRGSGY